jgi:PST family polysaccharide transporter
MKFRLPAKMSPSSVTLISQFIRIGVQVASIVIFSNLFPPAVFGLFAIIAIVMAAGETLRDFGLGATGLSSRNLTQQESSNLFWLSLTFGFALAMFVALLSSPLAALFNQEELLVLQPFVAMNLIINGFQIQYQVRLSHQGRFVLLGLSEVFAQIAGLVLGLCFFFLGFGYWAIAVQLVTTPATLAIVRFVGSTWLPSRPQNVKQTIQVLKVSSKYGVGQLLSFGAKNVDNFMVGLLWGPTALGQYSRAFQLQSLPLVGALWPLTNVFVPRLTKLESQGQDSDLELLRVQFKVGISTISFFSALAAASNILLPAVLGSNWAFTSQLFVVLAVAGCIESLNFVTHWRFLTHGASRQYLVYSTIAGSFSIINIIVSAFFGVTQVAIAIVINQLVYWAVGLSVQHRLLNLGFKDFLTQGLILLLAGMVGFVVSLAMQILLMPVGLPLLAVLLLQTLAGLVCFFITLFSFRASREMFVSTIKNISRKIPPLTS